MSAFFSVLQLDCEALEKPYGIRRRILFKITQYCKQTTAFIMTLDLPKLFVSNFHSANAVGMSLHAL